MCVCVCACVCACACVRVCVRTDAFVRFRRTRGELEHVGSFLPQAPAVQDLTVTLLEVIELQHVGGVQQSAEHTEVTSE